MAGPQRFPYNFDRHCLLPCSLMIAFAMQSHAPVAETLPPLSIAAYTAEEFLRAAGREQQLYLEVFHGNLSSGRIVHARLRDGQLAVPAEELREVGLALPDVQGWVELGQLDGLEYHYDVSRQALVLHAAPHLRRLQYLGYQPPDPVEVRRDQGLLLNYDFYANHWRDNSSTSLGTSLNWFGRFGSLQLSGVSRSGDERIGYRRLDSRWTYSDPSRLWTWTAGDLFTGGHAWTRPVRMAGLQWRRNFEVRPELITLPIPRFDGSAALPSTVELTVNDILQYGGEVEPGPFVLDSFPRISGAGTATLTVTDALGRSVEMVAPLYVDHRRLAAGLSDFSLEAGVLRTSFEGGWDDYGERAVASGSWLYGVTDTFTLETHGEASERFGLAGVGGVWSPDNRWGLISASASYSDGGDSLRDYASGQQYSLGYQWNGPSFGFDLLGLRRSRGYRDLADLDTDRSLAELWLQAQDRASLWLNTGRGSLSYSYLRWRDHLTPRRKYSTHSLTWTQNIGGRLSVSASVFGGEGGSGGSITLSLPLDDRHFGALSIQRQPDGGWQPFAQLRRRTPYDGGWGGWLQGGHTEGDYGQAALELRGRYGEMRAGLDRNGDDRGYFFDAGSSLVVMDGTLKLSRRIPDAFALVYTGIADMPVLSENRIYGHTDADGYLLIPDLRGWQRNRIGIDVDALGPDYAIPEVEEIAVPPDSAGQLVTFSVRRQRPAIFTLLDESGRPLAAGSRALLSGDGQGGELWVGYGGEIYIENLVDNAQLQIQLRERVCRYRLRSRPKSHTTFERATLRPDTCTPIDP